MRKCARPLLALALLCLGIAGSRAQGVPTVFINEIHYDNTGTDSGEFVEVAGPAGTSLADYSIVLYNGANGLVYDTDSLTGSIPNQQNGFGVVSLSYPVNGLQNGAPDGIALVQGANVIQFLSYEGTFVAVDGPAAGMTSVDIGVSEPGTGPVGESLRLVGTGTGYSDFSWAASAPHSAGSVNQGQTFSGTPEATIAINNVTVTEGNAGTTTASFTVTVSGAHPAGVTFNIATADGAGANAANAGSDYQARSLFAQTIPAAESTFTFDVTVNGDTIFEQDEEFVVNLSGVIGANVNDGQGLATISNDDAVPSDVVISQIYGAGGNNNAVLRNDFVELFNRSASTISLAGWSVQYQSSSGTGTWLVAPLSGSIAPNSYYLVQLGSGGSTGALLPAADATGGINMAAGSGKVAVLNTVTASAGNCPAFSATSDLVGYGGANCDEGAGPAPAPSASLAALRKRGGCFDSNNNNVDFSTGNPAPRNSGSPQRSCTFTSAAIHDIQGDEAVTPYLGQDVQTTGIVTARKNNGFFIQTAGDEDSNAATSQGLFVFTSSAPAVAVGDAVTARGTATEFFALTQVEASLPGDVTVDSSGHAVPAPVTLSPAMLDPSGAHDQLEPFESMRLHADTLISIAPTNQFAEIMTVLPGVPRPVREPGIPASMPVPPDPTSGAVDCCIPIWDENPERILIDTDGLAGAKPIDVTSHVVLSGVTGPLEFSFGAYKVLPEHAPAASPNLSAVPVRAALADELTIAGFNIENFAGNATQRRKAALAIRQVMRSPDIIGHVEIASLAALQTLADQVNADAAADGEFPAYQARLIPAPQGGTQHLGFLIKTSRVQIISTTQELAGQTFLDPVNGDIEDLHDRPPLVLRARALLPGRAPRPVIVVVNHLRSFIDVDLVGGEGIRVRAKRTAQAEATAQLLQSLQADNPGVPVIAIGDYNAYQFNDGYTDPIAILKGSPTIDEQIVVDQSPDLVEPDYVNLTDTLPLEQQYTFHFEGTAQALDHVLLNAAAAALSTGYEIARNNADFPEGPLFAADATRPERNSDHDMPVAYFSFPLTSDLSVSIGAPAAPVQTGASFSYQVTASNDGPDAASSVTVSVAAVAGMNFSSLTAPAGWSCTTPAPGAPGEAACVGSLAAGESVVFTAGAVLDCSVADTTSIAVSGAIGGSAFDPDAADNAASETIVALNPPPSINGVIAAIVVSPTSASGAVVSDAQLGSPVAVDNCSATIVRTGVPAGNVFPVGTTTVVYTATDSGGAQAIATQAVKVLSATESLQAIAADLRAIVAASTKAPLTARATDALKKVEKAIAYLEQSPADAHQAAIRIRQAMQDIEGLMNQGLLPGAAASALLQRLAGAAALL